MAEKNPDFAVACSFMERYGRILALPLFTINSLKIAIEDKHYTKPDIVTLHTRLMKKMNRTVNSTNWERSLVKVCSDEISETVGWELQQLGYSNMKTETKLEILKFLLESQFDENIKFKDIVNKELPEEMRVHSVGRDRNGLVYWFQQDQEMNLCVYREEQDDPDASSWSLVCDNKMGLEELLVKLQTVASQPPINNSEPGSGSVSTQQSDQEGDSFPPTPFNQTNGDDTIITPTPEDGVKIKQESDSLDRTITESEGVCRETRGEDLNSTVTPADSVDSGTVSNNTETSNGIKSDIVDRSSPVPTDHQPTPIIKIEGAENSRETEGSDEKMEGTDIVATDDSKQASVDNTESNIADKNSNNSSGLVENPMTAAPLTTVGENYEEKQKPQLDVSNTESKADTGKSVKDTPVDSVVPTDGDSGEPSAAANIITTSRESPTIESEKNSETLSSNSTSGPPSSDATLPSYQNDGDDKNSDPSSVAPPGENDQTLGPVLINKRTRGSSRRITASIPTEESEPSITTRSLRPRRQVAMKNQNYSSTPPEKKRPVATPPPVKPPAPRPLPGAHLKIRRPARFRKDDDNSSSEDSLDDVGEAAESDEPGRNTDRSWSGVSENRPQADESEHDQVPVVNDDTPCCKCTFYNHPELILLCDMCDAGYHTACLRPPLLSIPEGDWYCPDCEHKMLIRQLTVHLQRMLEEQKKRERVMKRKHQVGRYAYTGINPINIIGEGGGDQRGFTAERTKRQRKDINYKFDEFDDVIYDAIKDDLLEAQNTEYYPPPGRSRGKDMSTITGEERTRRTSGSRKKGRLTYIDSFSEGEGGEDDEEAHVSEKEEEEEEDSEEYRASESPGSDEYFEDNEQKRRGRRRHGRRSSPEPARRSLRNIARATLYQDHSDRESSTDDSEMEQRWRETRAQRGDRVDESDITEESEEDPDYRKKRNQKHHHSSSRRRGPVRPPLRRDLDHGTRSSRSPRLSTGRTRRRVIADESDDDLSDVANPPVNLETNPPVNLETKQKNTNKVASDNDTDEYITAGSKNGPQSPDHGSTNVAPAIEESSTNANADRCKNRAESGDSDSSGRMLIDEDVGSPPRTGTGGTHWSGDDIDMDPASAGADNL